MQTTITEVTEAMLDQVCAKIEQAELSSRMHFKQGNVRDGFSDTHRETVTKFGFPS